ncbi:MAG TPA: hypothetical protein PK176_11240 [Acidobacteriota bacterium]|nr:hypothetical protein [Acidobacteriota bacterium]HQM63878.1 hypothetical protein [Acidobacteriota bacterium]
MIAQIRRIFETLNDHAEVYNNTYRITLIRFRELSAQSRRNLSGRATNDWQQFKDTFINYQRQCGLTWNQGRERGERIGFQLESIVLPEELGQELAELLHDEVESGDLREQLVNQINYYQEFNNYIRIDISKVREGFKNWPPHRAENEYVFYPNSNRFRKRQNPFIVGIREREFSQKLEAPLKRKFNISYLKNVGDNHRESTFNNVDFAGFNIIDRLKEQDIQTFAFELKRGNDIPSIATAISQATNYRSFSNYSYIVIPNFERGDFYDPEVWEDYYQMCQNNSVGIVSVKCPEIVNAQTIFEEQNLSMVLRANFVECSDSDFLRDLFSLSNYEFCPLCSSFIKINEGIRDGCKWKSMGGDCMKENLEEVLDFIIKEKQNKEE